MRSSETRERILDAAFKQVLAVGVSRTTLTDVAKAAGLSRMTIYRHYESIERVLQDLMTREFNQITDSLVTDLPERLATATRAELVQSMIDALDSLTLHPLFLRLLATDPDLLLPYITERPGRFQAHAQQLLEAVLTLAIEQGEVTEDDPARLANSILLALRGYAFVDKSSWTGRERARTLADLATMLDGLLAPKPKSKSKSKQKPKSKPTPKQQAKR